jgi:hypothetical protein
MLIIDLIFICWSNSKIELNAPVTASADIKFKCNIYLAQLID